MGKSSGFTPPLKGGEKDGEKTYAVQLTIPDKWLRGIDETLVNDWPIPSKIGSLAEGALLSMCEGGIMLQPGEVKKLQEIFGKPVESSDIIEQFQRGVGRRDGKLQITISLDPAYEGVAQAAAEFQGKTVPQVLQDAWDTAWDNGDFYDPRVSTQRMLMTHDDKKELVAILGSDFANGTELAAKVRQYAADHEGLFGDLGVGDAK